jgi:hypothetical protein
MPDEAMFELLSANNHNLLHDVGHHMGDEESTLNHEVKKDFTVAKLLHLITFLSKEHGYGHLGSKM